MSNMSYCRFENTANDMRDCLEAIEDAGGLTAYIRDNEPSEYEIQGMKEVFNIATELIYFSEEMVTDIVSEMEDDDEL